ncbi:Remorin [Hibiscus syriacus]|uniref:Remorin n=1 Tax=Hibiscus syriacus TaxID=106335 RepID=A0A6A3A6C4_HIBSY|nr:Remorin [Hibiscus syriacus]
MARKRRSRLKLKPRRLHHRHWRLQKLDLKRKLFLHAGGGEAWGIKSSSSKAPEPEPKKISGGSHDRDVALAEVEKAKRLSFIKAWEDSEKTKAENKSQKKLSAIVAWENSKKAALEAKLKKIEEQLETKKAEYGERMKNKVALVHKEAEEKRAMVEAKRGEDVLKAEEMAAKYRATGQTPKKLLGCF